MASFLFFVMSFLSFSSEEPKRYEFTEPHMGTVFRVQLFAASEESAKKAAAAGFARVKALNAILSDYQSDTELMKLCQQAGKGPVKVSDELVAVLQESQRWSESTDGQFDVSIGPLVQLWRRARRTREVPTADAIAKARALVDYRSIKLDVSQQTVELTKPGMRLDLGGIAKGYAADELLRVLKSHGITSACVAAGGDVTVSARPPGSEGWVIAISALEKNGQPPVRLLLENQAVSTAGELEQFVEIDGKRYSHIVDPNTGLGIIGRRSCTVVSARGLVSDGADTAAYLLGHVKGIAMIDQTPGVACLFLVKEGEAVKMYPSKAWGSLRIKQ